MFVCKSNATDICKASWKLIATYLNDKFGLHIRVDFCKEFIHIQHYFHAISNTCLTYEIYMQYFLKKHLFVFTEPVVFFFLFTGNYISIDISSSSVCAWSKWSN